jgi:hypothetical protein
MGWGLMRLGDVYLEITHIPFGGGLDDTVITAARRLVPVPLSR